MTEWRWSRNTSF